MRIWRWRSGASLVGIGLLALMAAGPATSSAAAVRTSPTTHSYFKLVNNNSGKCLDTAEGSATGKVQQWSCNNNLWQYWAIYPSGNDGYLIQNYWTGQCLAANGNTPGSAVIQRTCNPNSHAQNWYANYTGTGAWFYYITAQVTGGCVYAAEEPCAIHPSGGSTDNGKGAYIQFPNSANVLRSFWWEEGAQL
jgi:hypothetical protein